MTDEFTDLYAKAEATIQGVGMHPDTAWPSYLRVGNNVFELPHENSRFIAAASPTVILSLIAELREAREAAQTQTEANSDLHEQNAQLVFERDAEKSERHRLTGVIADLEKSLAYQRQQTQDAVERGDFLRGERDVAENALQAARGEAERLDPRDVYKPVDEEDGA